MKAIYKTATRQTLVLLQQGMIAALELEQRDAGASRAAIYLAEEIFNCGEAIAAIDRMNGVITDFSFDKKV